ncbi:hypothetical protein [Streptomyces sp. NPDC048603]|uniref:hypothetical protein n=1 Tax=Streptomyces sp. NPDC048603 TaxID=3365577 RepID=UPI00371C4C27
MSALAGQHDTDVDALGPYTHLWQESGPPARWVLWNTPEGTLVFDTEINCPVFIDDEPVLARVLHRMRRAGAPEGREYPGRPCS